jgi:zinc protease
VIARSADSPLSRPVRKGVSRRYKRALTLTTLVVALVLPTAAQQAPDRSKPPAPGPAPALTLPAVQKTTLANGVRVWLLEHHEVPIVQANLVVLSGASADVPGQFGAASMTAAMLDEGAAGKAALVLADEVEFLGAQLSTAATFDASAVRLSTPAARLPAALGLLADVALAPDFPAEELERLRTERLTARRLPVSRSRACSMARSIAMARRPAAPRRR